LLGFAFPLLGFAFPLLAERPFTFCFGTKFLKPKAFAFLLNETAEKCVCLLPGIPALEAECFQLCEIFISDSSPVSAEM
jgi:hypothetical protein